MRKKNLVPESFCVIDIINATHLFDVLGLLQGVLLGAILMAAHRPRKRPSFLLGLFILLYTLEIIPILLEDLGYADTYPFIYWLPVNFAFASLPLLYLYARRLTGQLQWRCDWWHLLFGIIEFGVFSVLCFLSLATGDPLVSMDTLDIVLDNYLWAGIIFNFCYAVVIIVYLRGHRRRLLDVYSDTAGKGLRWLSVSAWLFAGYMIFLFVLTFDPFYTSVEVYSLTLAGMNVLMIYYLTVYGMRQLSFFMPATESIFAAPAPRSEPAAVPAPPAPEAVAAPPAPGLHRLRELMDQEAPYLNPHLTIDDLAEQLQTSARSLSRLINTEAGTHFNGFINAYRTERAKDLLRDPSFHNYSMEGIAREVGFNSKATFYSAFKQATQLTPARYKSQATVS